MTFMSTTETRTSTFAGGYTNIETRAADAGPVVEVHIEGRLDLDTYKRRPGRTEWWTISRVIVSPDGRISYYGVKLVKDATRTDDDDLVVLHDGSTVGARLDRRQLDSTGRRSGVEDKPLPYAPLMHIGQRDGNWGRS